MDLDALERLAQDNVDDGVSVDFALNVLDLIARVRAAEAERDRLRALFDDASAHNPSGFRAVIRTLRKAHEAKAHGAESGER